MMCSYVIRLDDYDFPVIKFQPGSSVKNYAHRVSRSNAFVNNKIPGDEWAPLLLKKDENNSGLEGCKLFEYSKSITEYCVALNEVLIDDIFGEIPGKCMELGRKQLTVSRSFTYCEDRCDTAEIATICM